MHPRGTYWYARAQGLSLPPAVEFEPLAPISGRTCAPAAAASASSHAAASCAARAGARIARDSTPVALPGQPGAVSLLPSAPPPPAPARACAHTPRARRRALWGLPHLLGI